MKKILIANRGEIAIRIMRSAKEMGIRTVAVYSEADRTALHVRYADEAVCIGSPLSAESYLSGKKIIAAALQFNADAIHPGYGFLSENAGFAKAVSEVGLIFIGPSSSAMEKMGNKLAAKETARMQGVPLVPGTEKPLTDLKEAKKIAAEIGYPILIKASAGGGGKGMRKVMDENELSEQINRARSEAAAAFGNSAVFIEKFINNPRHIEIQILGDQFGNMIHLFERECSIQRRHQKLIEEAPSSLLTESLRKKMSESAIAIARASDYHSAGTVEFLVDENNNYYFLEMNTRLQVEHPVTEMITGIDLVKEQILIAQGEKLRISQSEIKIKGHSIEIRVCAEDPLNNFLPDAGHIDNYTVPQGIGIRVDGGVETGSEVSVYYDPLIAKLIVHGSNRKEAIERMIRAIDEFGVTGIQTTLPFGKWAMQHPLFREGNFNIRFIEEHFRPELFSGVSDQDEMHLAAALAASLVHEFSSTNSMANPVAEKTGLSAWKKNRLPDY